MTRAASALWTGSTATILRDILLAVADVRALNQGFEPDTVLVDDLTYAYVASETSRGRQASTAGPPNLITSSAAVAVRMPAAAAACTTAAAASQRGCNAPMR